MALVISFGCLIKLLYATGCLASGAHIQALTLKPLCLAMHLKSGTLKPLCLAIHLTSGTLKPLCLAMHVKSGTLQPLCLVTHEPLCLGLSFALCCCKTRVALATARRESQEREGRRLCQCHSPKQAWKVPLSVSNMRSLEPPWDMDCVTATGSWPFKRVEIEGMDPEYV